MNFKIYLTTLERDLSRGNATEHTHRSTLKQLLEDAFPSVTATNEPKRIKAGAPDYVLQKGQTPLGYIEAKDVGVDLSRVEKTEQMKRYFASLGNLLLTDYLEFRWYVEGQDRKTVRLGTWLMGKIVSEADGEKDLEMLLNAFMEAKAPTLNSPVTLAKKMAALAQQIRYSINEAFNAEDLTDDNPDPLHDQYKAFKDVLMKDLTAEQFADMYAQTITYGMFAARTSPSFKPPFTRERAAYDIPKTNPFLQQMFQHMAGPDLPPSLDWIVDDLVNLLAHTDVAAILANFGKRTRQEDPIVHFYETFLSAYDPKMREARGVYYTPEPVVSYIVRSVDHILKTEFGLADGLADTSKVKVIEPERQGKRERKTRDVHKVQLLDPATGTATFLHATIDQIHQTVTNSYGSGAWSGYVREHLLPRLYGFELLMAPYTVAHMKLGLQLRELGYDFSSPERLKIYLTNALEEAHDFPSLPLFGQMIARESQEAGQIKQDAPVMVILGNPPYSYESSNTGEWISNIIREYYKVDGQPLGERNPKGLQDDYVKFIRFAQWRIEQTGYGILGFVTNHGYLDNPTFRGMRQSLMNTFDKIYLLDLHGNSKKKEKAPDGSKDENVFDIQQGVAICLMVKTQT
jgi:predicted helicase